MNDNIVPLHDRIQREAIVNEPIPQIVKHLRFLLERAESGMMVALAYVSVEKAGAPGELFVRYDAYAANGRYTLAGGLNALNAGYASGLHEEMVEAEPEPEPDPPAA